MAQVVSLNATQQAVPMFIRGLADDLGLKVVFGGDPGYLRETHTIYLPPYASFPADKLASDVSLTEMQQAVQELFFATGFHEFGHPLYTTPGHRNDGDLGGFLWNALEDVRCDSIQQLRFAGAKGIFNAGYGRLIKMGFWQHADASDFAGLFSSWVLYQGRCKLADQSCFDDLAASSHALLIATAGDAFVDQAWAIVSKVKSAVHTKDVFEIVQELLAFLKVQATPESQSGSPGGPPPPKSSGEDQGSTQSGVSPTPPQGSDPGKDQSSGPQGSPPSDPATGTSPPQAGPTPSPGTPGKESAPAAPPAPGPSGNDAGSPPASDAPGQPTSGSSPGPSSVPATSGARKVASAALDAVPSQMPADVGSVLSSVLNVVSKDAIDCGAQAVSVARSRPAVSSTSSYCGDGDTRPLTIKLRNLLLAQTRASTSHDRRGSRVDSRMLSRVAFGVREVFVHEQPAKLVHTALKVLVDRSQSMQGARIDIARRAALRVCIAAGDVDGTNVSASAFPEKLDGRKDQVRELMPFGSKARTYARNFLTLDAPDWASTPLAPALTLAMYELKRQPQPRKVCLVVTDGAPNGGGVSEKAVIAQMRRMGIQVLGLGIQTMRVTDLFDNSEVVHDVAEVEAALFKLLQTSMLSRVAA